MIRQTLAWALISAIGLQLLLPGAMVAAPLTASTSPEASSRPETAPSPEPTPAPTPDVELDQAKRAAMLAEERKRKEVAEQEEAAARRDKLKAQFEPFGDPTKVSVPTGSVTTDQAGFVESQMLAQEAAREITDRLSKFLRARTFSVTSTSGGKQHAQIVCAETLVIYNSSDITTLALYSSVLDQLKSFQREFEEKHGEAGSLLLETDPKDPQKSIAPAVLAAPGIATGLIKSVAELVNLFRTDTEFKNKNITITEDMIVSYLIHSFNEEGKTKRNAKAAACSKLPAIFYPALYPPNLLAASGDSELIKIIRALGDAKATAKADVGLLDARIKLIEGIAANIENKGKKEKEKAAKEKEKAALKDPRCRKKSCQELAQAIEKLQGEITKLDDAIKNAKVADLDLFAREHEEWLRKLKLLKAQTEFLIESADQVTLKLNTPDDATKLTAMAQLLRAERLAQVLNQDTSFTLRVAATANGTTKIKKNLFVDAKVRHSAGANLVYQLFDRTGRVVMGDTMQFYYDYKSSKAVREEVEKQNPQ